LVGGGGRREYAGFGGARIPIAVAVQCSGARRQRLIRKAISVVVAGEIKTFGDAGWVLGIATAGYLGGVGEQVTIGIHLSVERVSGGGWGIDGRSSDIPGDGPENANEQQSRENRGQPAV